MEDRHNRRAAKLALNGNQASPFQPSQRAVFGITVEAEPVSTNIAQRYRR